jgi:hypothetical protein
MPLSENIHDLMLYFRLNIFLSLSLLFNCKCLYDIHTLGCKLFKHSHFSQGTHMTLNILCLSVVGNHHVRIGFLIFDFLWSWGMNSGLTPWATPPALFCDGFYWDRVSELFCPSYLRTIILISASCVANITCVSHCGTASEGFKPIWRGRCSLCCT